MKKPLLVLVFAPVISLSLLAQKPDEHSALTSMVETERSFARTSEEKGTRPAFLAFIAEDGILFRPRAVKGKQWMLDHPVPASDKRPVLSWQPTFAGVAGAGDMGYTSGPWQFREDVKAQKPAAFGHFVTVWKKQTDGSWRFAVDLGISHPEQTQPDAPLQLTTGHKQPSKGTEVNIHSEIKKLLMLEHQFSNASAVDGAGKSFLAHASGDVRVYREGKVPFVGKDAAAGAFIDGARWTWDPQAADVSASGDVGYSYGTYNLTGSDKTKNGENGNYFRIWKKEGGAWKVVMDVANPIPEPKTN